MEREAAANILNDKLLVQYYIPQMLRLRLNIGEKLSYNHYSKRTKLPSIFVFCLQKWGMFLIKSQLLNTPSLANQNKNKLARNLKMNFKDEIF